MINHVFMVNHYFPLLLFEVKAPPSLTAKSTAKLICLSDYLGGGVSVIRFSMLSNYLHFSFPNLFINNHQNKHSYQL